MASIACGRSQCPICGRESEVMIGPCNRCTEHFHKHGSYARVQWVGPPRCACGFPDRHTNLPCSR